MPKAVEVKSTTDCVGKNIKKGDKAIFTLYEDSSLYVGPVVKVTKGIINPQVYIEWSRFWTDYEGHKHTYTELIRKPAKKVVKVS